MPKCRARVLALVGLVSDKCDKIEESLELNSCSLRAGTYDRMDLAAARQLGVWNGSGPRVLLVADWIMRHFTKEY
jgi:hypothetical protein